MSWIMQTTNLEATLSAAFVHVSACLVRLYGGALKEAQVIQDRVIR